MTLGMLTKLSGTRSLNPSNPSSHEWSKAVEAFDQVTHQGQSDILLSKEHGFKCSQSTRDVDDLFNLLCVLRSLGALMKPGCTPSCTADQVWLYTCLHEDFSRIVNSSLPSGKTQH